MDFYLLVSVQNLSQTRVHSIKLCFEMKMALYDHVCYQEKDDLVALLLNKTF